MYNNQPFQDYSQPLNGYNQPLQPMQPMQPIQYIPGTAMIAGITVVGETAGTIYLDPRNPKLGTDTKGRTGYLCDKCKRGILLMDMDMVRNGDGGILLMLVVICPCLCCYFMTKKRKCTNCNEEFPNKCC